MDEMQGGDSACWLAQVCPQCGALLEDTPAPCWRCGREPDEASDDEGAHPGESDAATPR